MRGPRLSSLPEWALELVDTTPVAHLGLLDEDGHPRVQPITFVRVADELWSAIDDKPKRTTPARIRRLQAHPRAALTVDRYEADWTRLAWVQILGDVTFHPTHEDALRALAARYPAYRANPPRGPFLELSPIRVLWWRASS